MMMWQFLAVGAMTLISIGACTLVNNAHHHLTKQLIAWLKGTVKQSLVLNGEPDKARAVSRDDIPKLEDYLNKSQNYGVINIIGLVLAVIFLWYGAAYHEMPILLSMLTCLFFVFNVMFLPKTFDRHFEVTIMNNSYVDLMNLLEAKSGSTATSSS